MERPPRGMEPRQKFGGGSASNEDLRAYAQQGDLAAVRDLLNQALKPHGILVHPVPGKNGLHLELGAKAFPQTKMVRQLIEQQLRAIQPIPWQQVSLVAYRLVSPTQKASEMPAWVERFELGGAGQTLRSPHSPPMPSPLGNSMGNSMGSPIQNSMPKGPQHNLSRPNLSQPIAPSPSQAQALRANSIPRESWQALGIGLVLAAVISALGFLRLLFYGFVILVHELGHAIANWIFGQPAIPAVNLLFGGGITLSLGQSKLLLLLIYLGWGYLIYRLRGQPRLAVILGAVGIVYSLCIWGQLDESLPIFMGHGFEAIAIALCLYLGISGQLCRFAFDQTIYAMLGWFLLLQRVDFAWKLRTDFVAQSIYRDGIGGMLDNDFVKLSESYWGWSLENIALLFLVCCLAAPVVAFLLYRYGAWLRRGWRFLLSPVL